MRLAALLPIVSAAACGSFRHAETWRASADIDLDVRGIRREAPAAGGEEEDRIEAGLALRALGGPGRAGYALGLDLHLGGGTGGGFAYDAALRPLGAGLHLGTVGTLSCTFGAGVRGVTGQQPFTFTLPVEAGLEVNLNSRIHVRMFAATGVLDADPRAGATLRLGKGGQRHRERWGNGGYLGVIVGERDDVRELGFVVGYGITDRYVPYSHEPVDL